MKGTAQRWFEPNLEYDDDDLPEVATCWNEFQDALKATFGEPDPEASAAIKLENLVMRDHHHLHKYDVDFNEYSALTGFNERALWTRYYRGLAPRLKDALVYAGRPRTLTRLRELSQELDLRYWERKEDDRFFPSASKQSISSSSRSSGTLPATSTSEKSSTTHPKSSSRTSTPAARSSTPAASSSKPNKPDLSKVLGPDGKLLPEEKERRKKNDLCMVCGGKGHFSDKCPHRKESVQARAANLEVVEESEDPSLGAESDDSSK